MNNISPHLLPKVDGEGIKHVLGIWIAIGKKVPHSSAHVCAHLANLRGHRRFSLFVVMVSKV